MKGPFIVLFEQQRADEAGDGVAAINLGNSDIPLLLALLVPAGFAALFGYFVFWGRLSDVYLGVVALTVALQIFQRYCRQCLQDRQGRAGRLQRHPRDAAAQPALE